jgi:hypothetical protein
MLNQIVSSQIGVVFRVSMSKAKVRSARNELHMYLVRWQELRELRVVRRLCPLRLRDGRKINRAGDVRRSTTLPSGDPFLPREFGRIR